MQKTIALVSYVIPWEDGGVQISGSGIPGLGLIITNDEGKQVHEGDQVEILMSGASLVYLNNITTNAIIRDNRS